MAVAEEPSPQQSSHGDPPEPLAKKQKLPGQRAVLTKDEKAYYSAWIESRMPGQERSRNQEHIKLWMRNELKAWQQEHGKGGKDKPEDGPQWYYDRRIDGIKLGYFDRTSDKNIVKSYLVGYINGL